MQAVEANMVFVEYYGEGSPIMKSIPPVPFIHGIAVKFNSTAAFIIPPTPIKPSDCKNNTFIALRYYDSEVDTVFAKYYVNGREL